VDPSNTKLRRSAIACARVSCAISELSLCTTAARFSPFSTNP
jgi:hypothetical protein